MQNETVSLPAGLAALLLSTAAFAADDGAAPPSRPNYQVLRFNENWSVLRDRPAGGPRDFWDPVKYVPLSDDGEIWASFGGHTRLRLEGWSNFAFGAPANDDDAFLLWRLTLHADVHFGDNLRVFIEGKSALSTDRDLPGGRRTLDVDSLALEQAFVDLRLPFGDDRTLTLRPGRQALSFGRQRLVSPLPWGNSLRRWDGVSAIFQCADWNVHGFWSQFVPVDKYDFNEPDEDNEFFGVYATGPLGETGIRTDLYYLGLDRSPAAFNGTAGAEERHTVGGRLFGSIGQTALDYDFEGAYQFGDVGAGDVSAFMIGSELGYTLGETPAQPRLFLGFDYGSGDDEAGGDVETFNQLFPLGHAYLGYMDFVGRQNVIDVSGGVSLTPIERLTLRVAGHAFWRADTDDALYNAGGGIVRAGGSGSEREVGQELDVVLRYMFNTHLTGELGYSHFFPGDFIDESGASSDMDFVYGQLVYTF